MHFLIQFLKDSSFTLEYMAVSLQISGLSPDFYNDLDSRTFSITFPPVPRLMFIVAINLCWAPIVVIFRRALIVGDTLINKWENTRCIWDAGITCCKTSWKQRTIIYILYSKVKANQKFQMYYLSRWDIFLHYIFPSFQIGVYCCYQPLLSTNSSHFQAGTYCR